MKKGSISSVLRGSDAKAAVLLPYRNPPALVTIGTRSGQRSENRFSELRKVAMFRSQVELRVARQRGLSRVVVGVQSDSQVKRLIPFERAF